jgi:hypothetical protein
MVPTGRVDFRRLFADFAKTVLIFGIVAAAFSVRAASVNTPGDKPTCATKAPQAMLNDAEPQKHSFQQFPENRATETSTFPDGTKLDIETKGCAGPAVTRLSFAFSPAAAKGKRSVATLVSFVAKNQDALAKTPLGLPGPSRAIRAIDEGKLIYAKGDRICFDKDDPQVVPMAVPCTHAMTLSWARADKNLSVQVNYQSE